MTVAKIKTKAEQGLAEQFSAVSAKLPGNAQVQSARQAAIDAFDGQGLPHRHIEEWKYTDLRNIVKDALPLAVSDTTEITIADVIVALGPLQALDAQRIVLVNGAYRKELSSMDQQDGVAITSLAEALAEGPVTAKGFAAGEAAPADDAVLALNTAYMTDGAVVEIAKDQQVDKPILIAHVRAGSQAGFTAARHVLRAGANSKVTVLEAFVSLPGAAAAGQMNTASEVDVGDGAHVDHIKVAVDTGAVTHLASWIGRLGKDSQYHGFHHTQGVGLARNQMFVTFDGEGGDLDLSGSYLGRGTEHVDNTLVVDHAVPHGTSRELFKCVLDENARGIFQGKVIVQQIAQKTDGKQMAQALMLSPDTEFDSKPELEIYADDVLCGHGSTVAEIDEDLMFYCQARGIDKETARSLLVQSFIGEAIEVVENEDIRQCLFAYAEQWLGERAES
ncbi:MAG: Fe-S cluster assembly protein SufD [Hyphomicrobiaceae bacterium]